MKTAFLGQQCCPCDVGGQCQSVYVEHIRPIYRLFPFVQVMQNGWRQNSEWIRYGSSSAHEHKCSLSMCECWLQLGWSFRSDWPRWNFLNDSSVVRQQIMSFLNAWSIRLCEWAVFRLEIYSNKMRCCSR